MNRMAFLGRPVGIAAAVGFGLCLAFAVGIGIGSGGDTVYGSSQLKTSAASAEQPGDATAAIPAEAREFVNEYGARYSHPVATYYASKAYAAEYGPMPVIDQPYIDSYVMKDGIEQQSSDLGFWRPYMPLDQPVNNDTFAKLVNDMVIPTGLNVYINLIAKNPHPDAIALIDNEFLKYQGGIGSGYSAPGSENRQNTLTLMETLKTIAGTYGSGANYKIVPISLNQDDAEMASLIDSKPAIDSINDDNLATRFHAKLALRIDIDTYDEAGRVIDKRDSVDMQMTVARVPVPGPADPGRVIIGQQ